MSAPLVPGFPADWLTNLEAALVQEFHRPAEKATFTRQPSLADALKVSGPGQTAYIVQPSLVMAGYFELEPDLLILDDHLGTVGLVHGLEQEEEPGAITRQVRRWIDEATYVRHLLEVNTADQATSAFLTRSVELVLVVPGENRILAEVGESLRDIAKQTSYLHAVGVNLLRLPLGEAAPELGSEIRRAFPWLLRRTLAWYLGAAAKSSRGNRFQRLRSVKLTNYRLPGERTLTLNPSSRVHLIYGHNGSGKSSLVEALELARTGRVDRLEAVDEKSYHDVIAYHRNGQTGPAELAHVHLEWDEEGTVKPKEWSATVTESGISETFDQLKDASSFRLDQTVMDRLGRSGDRMRADTFLSAFFPKDAKIHSDYHIALTAAREAREELPDTVRQKIESLAATNSKKAIETVVIDHLRWLLPPDKKQQAEPPAPLPPEAVEALLPLPFEVLESLTPLAPQIQAFVSRWRSTPAPRRDEAEADLRKLDEALKEIQSRFETILPALQTSAQALRELTGWFIEDHDSGPTLADTQAALDAWLERCALADLAERQLQIARTLSAASHAGWQAEERGGLFEYAQTAPGELDRLESQARRWAEEREEHFRRIASASRGMRGVPFGPAGAAPSQGRPHLSPPQIAALDQVGGWLPHSTPPPSDARLGSMIRTAVQRSRGSHYFGNYRLAHDPTWTQPLADAVSRLQTACERLQQLGKGSRMLGGSRRLEVLEKVVKRHQSAERAGAKVTRTLLANLQEVNGALNELIALFTPARWAYPPLRLTHTTAENGQHTVGVQAGEGTRADLRFNTAELNVFTMALFLLCAVRVPNLLRLLVFDDPLQNMDELTVTTLARGLGRVLRLLPEPWRLMLLFHGLDDLDRFRQEVPSWVYKLPWLTPAEREEGREMPAIESATGRRPELQPLENLLAAAPSS